MRIKNAPHHGYFTDRMSDSLHSIMTTPKKKRVGKKEKTKGNHILIGKSHSQTFTNKLAPKQRTNNRHSNLAYQN